MYPTTDDQGVRWLKAVSLEEKDFVPAFGCCEVVNQVDGVIYVRKPTNAVINIGDASRFCFAGASGIGPYDNALPKGKVTFDRPCAGVLERSSSQEVNTFRTEWQTQDRNPGSTTLLYAGPVAGSYKLSFGANGWWQVLNTPTPVKAADPQFCLVLPPGRKTLIPPPAFAYSGSIYTAGAGGSFNLPGISASLQAYWPDSYGYDQGATVSDALNVSRLITPYWYGKWQISIAATLWSATADRGERLAIGITTKRRGWSSDAVQGTPYAAREQDITISAYGDITHLSKENVAVTHTRFLYPFTEIDIINASDVQASISDVTISLTALDTTASEDDLSDYDSYETTLRNLGL